MKQIYSLPLLLMLIFGLWNYPVIYPLKLLVVFFHESSHAIATWLTGGTVEELVLVKEQGGHVLSRGGNLFIILSAGYLGSLLWGVILFVLAVATRFDRIIMACLGLFMVIISLLFAKGLFTLGFSLTTASLMLLAARFLSQPLNDLLLRLIALTSMMYAPLDIYSDTISRSHLKSDAYMLAEQVGGSTLMWGMVWISISLMIIYSCFRWVIRRPSTRSRVPKQGKYKSH